jgi:hypothetical protein
MKILIARLAALLRPSESPFEIAFLGLMNDGMSLGVDITEKDGWRLEKKKSNAKSL